jgi:hypothetical protein
MRDGSYSQTMKPGDTYKRWTGTGALEILRTKRNLQFGDIIDGREVMYNVIPVYDARI